MPRDPPSCHAAALLDAEAGPSTHSSRRRQERDEEKQRKQEAKEVRHARALVEIRTRLPIGAAAGAGEGGAAEEADVGVYLLLHRRCRPE